MKLLALLLFIVASSAHSHEMSHQRIYLKRVGVVKNVYTIMNNFDNDAQLSVDVFYAGEKNRNIDPDADEGIEFKATKNVNSIIKSKRSVNVRVSFVADKAGVYKVFTTLTSYKLAEDGEFVQHLDANKPIEIDPEKIQVLKSSIASRVYVGVPRED